MDNRVRPGRLAVRRRVGPGLRGEQRGLRRLPGRLHRARRRSPRRRHTGRRSRRWTVQFSPPAPRTRTARPSRTLGTSATDGDLHRPNPSHTYTAAGTYDATAHGDGRVRRTAVDYVPVASATRGPVVTIECPENGKVADFGDKIPYKISVADPEDGTTGSGNCSDIRIEVKLGHDTHAHELHDADRLRGHLHGHRRGRPRRRRERVHGPHGQLHGRGQRPRARRSPAPPRRSCQPKLKQAEYYATTGRTADGVGTGDPGVTERRPPADVGGGNASSPSSRTASLDLVQPVQPRGSLEGDVPRGLGRRAASSSCATTTVGRPAGRGDPALSRRTGGWQTWTDVTSTCRPRSPQGTHRLFVVFRHPDGATGSGVDST